MDAVIAQSEGRPQWLLRVKNVLESPVLVAAFLVVGIAMRTAHYFAGLSFWYDEAFLLVPIYERSAFELIGPLPTQTIIPPLFLWLLKGLYLLAGPGELAMRLPAFVAGLLGLVLLLPAALRVIGRPGAYWAVAFCALSYHHVFHGSEVRCYSIDFLASVVLFFTCAVYVQTQDLRAGRTAAGVLLTLGLLLPWISFASVLAFAGVSLALFTDLLERGDRSRWRYWAALNAVLLVSVFGVWYIQARHMYYPGLVEHWRGWDGFPADSSVPAVASWTMRRLEGLPEYGNSGLGIPLLVLAAWGVGILWRQSRPLTVLLVAPVLVTYCAALATKYPFSGRTVFFLAPSVWCLAMAGLADLWQRASWRWHSALLAPLLLILLGVAGFKIIKGNVPPRAQWEFREAICYVYEQRASHDDIRIWCPEIDEVYAGHVLPELRQSLPAGFTAKNANETVGNQPLWIVAPPNAMNEMTASPRQLGMRETQRRKFRGVDVVRLEPDGLVAQSARFIDRNR